MKPWSGLTQNLCLWPPYIYLLRTRRSHTLQSDWSARHSPSQWCLGELDITMYHFVHQRGLVDAKGGHDITFPILTPLCVWFWGVVIQGHDASSHDLQTFLQRPLFSDLYVCFQHSWLFHPSMNLWKTLSIPLQKFRPLVTSTLDHPLLVGYSWGTQGT